MIHSLLKTICGSPTSLRVKVWQFGIFSNFQFSIICTCTIVCTSAFNTIQRNRILVHFIFVEVWAIGFPFMHFLISILMHYSLTLVTLSIRRGCRLWYCLCTFLFHFTILFLIRCGFFCLFWFFSFCFFFV